MRDNIYSVKASGTEKRGSQRDRKRNIVNKKDQEEKRTRKKNSKEGSKNEKN